MQSGRLGCCFPPPCLPMGVPRGGWGPLCPSVGVCRPFLCPGCFPERFFSSHSEAASSGLRGLAGLVWEGGWVVPALLEGSEGQQREEVGPSFLVRACLSQSGICGWGIIPSCFLSSEDPWQHSRAAASVQFSEKGKGRVSVHFYSLGEFWTHQKSTSTTPLQSPLSLSYKIPDFKEGT